MKHQIQNVPRESCVSVRVILVFYGLPFIPGRQLTRLGETWFWEQLLSARVWTSLGEDERPSWTIPATRLYYQRNKQVRRPLQARTFCSCKTVFLHLDVIFKRRSKYWRQTGNRDGFSLLEKKTHLDRTGPRTLGKSKEIQIVLQ